MSHPSAYQNLTSIFTQLYRYNHLAAIVGWDRAAMMPAKGNEARAAAQAELDVLIHHTLTGEVLKQALAESEQEELSGAEKANVREARRLWAQANLLPASLVEAKALAGARCEHAWREQRAANDWNGFLTNFKEVVKLSREEAALLADAKGVGRYEALMDKYEPGMSCAEVDRIFADVKSWLPGLLEQVSQKQSAEQVVQPTGPFDVNKQRELGLAVMKLLQFDFDAGRLDISVHPFCGGVAEDVRITTRYYADDFSQSLMGVVHETGHARYEQSLPRPWLDQPLGTARSMGIHESQSLSFEMQLGRSAPFLQQLSPLVNSYLGVQPAFAADNLAKLYTRVKPGLIRVDADELSYPAHVILRYEIERALMEGDIEAEDIPAWWDEKMMQYLGLDTRGNYKNGCLQDIHWTDGSFGYFPSYTLGAMYAAQFFATIRKAHSDLDSRIASGDLSVVFDWLSTHIWQQGSLYETGELVRLATGEALNPMYFRQHLTARYLG